MMMTFDPYCMYILWLAPYYPIQCGACHRGVNGQTMRSKYTFIRTKFFIDVILCVCILMGFQWHTWNGIGSRKHFSFAHTQGVPPWDQCQLESGYPEWNIWNRIHMSLYPMQFSNLFCFSFISIQISRQSIDACKNYFRKDLNNNDWKLMIELKKLFQIL